MSRNDYPPKGKEKKDILKLLRLFGPLKKLVTEAAIYGNSINCFGDMSLQDALKGVRCSGSSCRVLALVETKEDFKEIRHDIDALLRLTPRIDKLLIAMGAILNEWRICPECHGECGQSTPDGRSWDDSEHCGGRGVVEK